MKTRSVAGVVSLVMALGCRTPGQGQSATPPPDTVTSQRPLPTPPALGGDAGPSDVVMQNEPPPEPPPPAHPAENAPFPVGRGVRAVGFESAAAGPPVWVGDALYGAFAVPATDGNNAELKLVRWSGEGVNEVAHVTVHGMQPGAALAVLPEGEGVSVVWQGVPMTDAGLTTWRVGCTRTTCAAERAGTPAEQTAGGWAFGTIARRSREGTQEMAPEVSSGNVAVRFERLRTVAVARVGTVEVARSADLLGYLRAAAVAPGTGGAAYVALSRGACSEHRIELFRVANGVSRSLGIRRIGQEVGVRWMRVEPGPGGRVAVSWYQDLIPLRLQCTRGEGAPTVDDHGLRVAVFSESEAAAPAGH